MKTKFCIILSMALLASCPVVWAWDTEPDEEGLYDKFYDRPTYFPESMTND